MSNIAEFDALLDEIQRRYEIIRPMLLRHVTAKEGANQLKLHENTLSKYIRRFNEYGIVGLPTNGMGQRISNGLPWK